MKRRRGKFHAIYNHLEKIDLLDDFEDENAEWIDLLVARCRNGHALQLSPEFYGVHDGDGVVSDSPITEYPKHSERNKNGACHRRKRNWRSPHLDDRLVEWCRQIILDSNPESDPYLLRLEQIRTIIGWFPHSISADEMHMVALELADPEWVRVNSEKRNNMSWDELLWRRTRFLAGHH
jgi:hypothetical protein